MLSDPLALLVLLAALVMAVMAPAFHYHQFGEATRMARDAGLSALFTCGTAFAVFTTIRAFRREVESGTLEMALAHPVSRTGFFLAKTFGAFMAYAVFLAIVVATSLVIVVGAAIGGEMAGRSGDVARLYGPCFAAGVAVIVLPLVVGAVLNRFARFRFGLSSCRRLRWHSRRRWRSSVLLSSRGLRRRSRLSRLLPLFRCLRPLHSP